MKTPVDPSLPTHEKIYKKTIQEKVDEKLADHKVLRAIYDYGIAIIISTIGAFAFSFGFAAFLSPTRIMGDPDNPILKLITGGVSGISQNLQLILHMIGGDAIDESIVFSISYFVINIPILVLAWKGIGKRFAVLSLINVAEISLFTSLISGPAFDWIADMSWFATNNGGMLARALFGGACTGISSAVCFKWDFSAGGIDIIAYYVAIRKRQNVGKYTFVFNLFIMVLFCILHCFDEGWGPQSATNFMPLFYSLIYLFVVTVVIDLIHIRNKKCEVRIVTKKEGLSTFLLKNIPHGATIEHGKGAFSGEDKIVISMVVSSYEVDKVIKMIKKEDDHSFITVIALEQVYGRFFMRPIK